MRTWNIRPEEDGVLLVRWYFAAQCCTQMDFKESKKRAAAPEKFGAALVRSARPGRFWGGFSDSFSLIVVDFGLSIVSAGGSAVLVWHLGSVLVSCEPELKSCSQTQRRFDGVERR